jgi:hypothetical protein
MALSPQSFRSRAIVAVAAAAVCSSLLALAILVITGQFVSTGSNAGLKHPGDILVIAAIALIWAPAVALIPAALLGYFIERPKARWLIANRTGFAVHLALSILAASALSILFRIALHLINPSNPLVDLYGLGLFAVIGLGSGLAWWFIVIVPGRRG